VISFEAFIFKTVIIFPSPNRMLIGGGSHLTREPMTIAPNIITIAENTRTQNIHFPKNDSSFHLFLFLAYEYISNVTHKVITIAKNGIGGIPKRCKNSTKGFDSPRSCITAFR
jgi:hypothetical protein